MVVQCASCQAKFRIADEKVTERGVRVRCTSCKNVFQVKKPGASANAGAPGPGSTMELSALDAAALMRPAPRPQPAAPARAPTGPVRAPAGPARAPPRPAGPQASSRSAAASNSARRLDADDLFGMSELTGDLPLAAKPALPPRPPQAKAPPGRPASGAKPATPAARPIPSFDHIDLEVDDVAPLRPTPAPARRNHPAPPLRPPVPPGAARPSLPVPLPPGPSRSSPVAPADEPDPFELAIAATPPPLPDDSFDDSTAGVVPPDEAPEPSDAEDSKLKLGAFKTQLKDPFEGMNLGLEGTGAIELSTAAAAPRKEKLVVVEKAAPPPPSPSPAEQNVPYSASRELVSSALTGLVGAALALAVIIAAAFSDDTGSGWLGFGRGDDVVATHVASGLYNTVSGKPVFYVRGRVENRSKKVRGPVRVIAELVADTRTNAHAEIIAGAEPGPEDVFGLKNSAEADKLNRSLQQSEVERRVAPGASLPFFVVIADPPPDLERHKLHVRLESVDAWAPPSPGKTSKGH